MWSTSKLSNEPQCWHGPFLVTHPSLRFFILSFWYSFCLFLSLYGMGYSMYYIPVRYKWVNDPIRTGDATFTGQNVTATPQSPYTPQCQLHRLEPRLLRHQPPRFSRLFTLPSNTALINSCIVIFLVKALIFTLQCRSSGSLSRNDFIVLNIFHQIISLFCLSYKVQQPITPTCKVEHFAAFNVLSAITLNINSIDEWIFT